MSDVAQYGVNFGWQLDPRATLYVPYTRLPEATQCFLASPRCNPVRTVMVDVSGDDNAYYRHMKRVWEVGEDFINMEHDIVPWPGAIDELLDCQRPWCFFGFQDRLPDLVRDADTAMFGLVRFRASIMRELPSIWKTPEPLHWRQLDLHFFEHAFRRHAVAPHQHWPSVLNANPAILEPVNRQVLPQWQWTRADDHYSPSSSSSI